MFHSSPSRFFLSSVSSLRLSLCCFPSLSSDPSAQQKVECAAELLVRLQVFSRTETLIDWRNVGVTADISPGALPRKSKPVDIDGRAARRAVRACVMDGLLIIVSEAGRWRRRQLLTSSLRLVTEPVDGSKANVVDAYRKSAG